MKTRGSRRISSASASRTASPNVNSRTATAVSGIHVLLHFIHVRIRRGHRKLDSLLDLRLHFRLNLIQPRTVRDFLREDHVREQLDGIALGFPGLLFLLGTIVFAADIADVMSHKPIGGNHQERWTVTAPCALD